MLEHTQKLIAEIQGCDAAMTPGPWRLAKPDEYPWTLGPCGEHREDTLTVIGEQGYGVMSMPMSITDHKADNWSSIATLRNTASQCAQIMRVAIEALEHIQDEDCEHPEDDALALRMVAARALAEIEKIAARKQ